MQRVIRIILTLAACSACAPPSTPSNPPLAAGITAIPTVDDVLEAYYQAVGGYGTLKAVESRLMIGEYVEGSLRARTELFQQRPQLRRVNLFTPAFDHFEGFDGQTWEYHRESGQASGKLIRPPIGGAAELAQRRGSEFDPSFVDYSARGFEARLLGAQVLNGANVYRVRIVRTDGWTLDYYFDVRTHLVAAVRKAMPLHAEGPDVESLTFYSDWRAVSGLLVPFSGEERNVKTGAIMNSLRWKLIEHNVRIEPEQILPPRN